MILCGGTHHECEQRQTEKERRHPAVRRNTGHAVAVPLINGRMIPLMLSFSVSPCPPLCICAAVSASTVKQ